MTVGPFPVKRSYEIQSLPSLTWITGGVVLRTSHPALRGQLFRLDETWESPLLVVSQGYSHSEERSDEESKRVFSKYIMTELSVGA